MVSFKGWRFLTNALIFSSLITLSLGSAMDMSHGMESDSNSDEELTNSATDVSSTSSLIPIPHETHQMHGVPILETKLSPAEKLFWESYNTTTFFNMETPYHNYVIVHFSLISLALFFLYPIALMLNNVESKWYLPALVSTDAVIVSSLFCYMVFINNVEDLYPGNVYGKMGIILFCLLLVHLVSAVIKTAHKFLTGNSNAKNYQLLKDSAKDLTNIPLSEFHSSGSTSPASTLYNRGSTSTDFDIESDAEEDMHSVLAEAAEAEHDNKTFPEKSRFSSLRDSIFDRLFNKPVVANISSALYKLAAVLFAATNYIMLCYLFVYYITGVSVLSCLGQGPAVFNLLAHFIKGGVFFALGLLTLARYLGAFTKAGLGWNFSFIGRYEQTDSIYLRKQPNESMLTMEMIESSLILFYGCTNIFLEHLAGAGGEWSAKDLQHVSIAFMYIGCGLCGVLTESKLSSWRKEKFESVLNEVSSHIGSSKIDLEAIRSCTPGFSPNPFPAFTIFFTGLLMSQHAQASALSTTIHTQWGNLLSYGSIFRVLTIVLMMFWKYNSYESLLKPVRPLTELLTAFALLAGGLIFMESTDPVINAMEYRGFTAMFSLNVNIGVVTLFMGWVMLLFTWRDRLRITL